MGGVPCAKILINRRVDAELLALTCESQAATELLMIKGDYETPALKALVDFEGELLATLQHWKNKFKILNDRYSQETEGYHNE